MKEGSADHLSTYLEVRRTGRETSATLPDKREQPTLMLSRTTTDRGPKPARRKLLDAGKLVQSPPARHV